MGLQEVKCLDINSMMSELKKENESGEKAITAIDVSGALDAELIGSILNCTPVHALSKNFKFVSMCKILAPRFLTEICIDMLYFRQDENKKAKFQFAKNELEKGIKANLSESLLLISRHLLDEASDATSDELEFDNITENAAIITKGQYKQDKNQINILTLNKLCKSVSTCYKQSLILLDPFNEIDVDTERHKLIYLHASKFNLEVKVLNLEKHPDSNKYQECDDDMFRELIAAPDLELFEDKTSDESENDENEYDGDLIP